MLLGVVLPFASIAQVITLDPTFAEQGIALLTEGRLGSDIVLQSDGRMVVVGDAALGSALVAVRYMADGSIDTTFGNNGLVQLAPGTTGTGRSVLVQNDGRILVGGSTSVAGDVQMFVARYEDNGTLDGTYGTNGVAVLGLSGLNDQLTDMVLMSDGDIVVVGGSGTGGTTGSVQVLRITPDGTPDLGFGDMGRVDLDLSPGSDLATAVAILPDDRLRIAYNTIGQQGPRCGIIGLLPDGSFDGSFNNGVTTAGPGPSHAWDLVLRDDGGCILVGDLIVNNEGDLLAMGYTPAGLPDPAFGQNGVVQVDDGTYEGAVTVVLRADGRIVLVGRSAAGPASGGLTMAQLLPDGTPDTSIGFAGRAYFTIGNNDLAQRAVTQPDGRVLVVGRTNTVTGDRIFVARFTTDLLTTASATEAGQSIRLYPNPVGHQLMVEGTSGARYRILDAMGREVARGTMVGQVVPVPALHPGLHFLEIDGNPRVMRIPFMKA